MALDPNIILGLRQPDFSNAVLGGFQGAAAIQNLLLNRQKADILRQQQEDITEANAIRQISPFVDFQADALPPDITDLVANSGLDEQQQAGFGLALQAFQEGNQKPLQQIFQDADRALGITPQELTTRQRDVAAATGAAPGSPEFQKTLLGILQKPQTQVSIGGAAEGETAFAKEIGKGQAKTVNTVRDEAELALDSIQSLDVLENIDVTTGSGEPFKQGFAKVADAFGFDGSRFANIVAGEAFNAEAQRMVLNVKSTQKGPQTETDQQTIAETVASLGKQGESNQFIISSARALSERKLERKEFYDNFLEDSGGKFRDESGTTVDSAWSKFKRNTPMVSAFQRTPQGLPVFFYNFERAVRAANPDATRPEILEAWRQREKAAKGRR